MNKPAVSSNFPNQGSTHVSCTDHDSFAQVIKPAVSSSFPNQGSTHVSCTDHDSFAQVIKPAVSSNFPNQGSTHVSCTDHDSFAQVTKPAVSISLSSYGADLVRRNGQASFIEVLAAAGANRIEWREELLTNEVPDLLATATHAQGLQSIYSSPTELWLAGQSRPNPELITALQNAEVFGSKWLKVSLGFFTDNNDLQTLAQILAQSPVQLLVENDQTLHGGRIEPFQRFFAAVEQHNLPIKMTFDIGNWQWQDQSATSAARLLGRHVGYVHCKAVARRADGKLVAVPPSATDLHLWEQLLRHMAQGVMRAAEYPLQGDDLVQLTTEHVAALARLGQSRLEPAHV